MSNARSKGINIMKLDFQNSIDSNDQNSITKVTRDSA